MRQSELFTKINKSIHRAIDLSRIEKVERAEISIETIQYTVSNHFNITVEKMVLKTKKRESVLPRQVSLTLCREYFYKNLIFTTKILELHNCAPDSNIIYQAKKTVKNLIETDDKFRNVILGIRKELDTLKKN